MPDSDSAPAARAVFALGAALTAGMALWLVFVTVTVLPARDPASIPFWRGVALGFLAWAAFSVWCLARPAPRGPLRAALFAGALLACVLGVSAAVRTLAGSAEHFEGYLVLMGTLLAAHGVAGLAWVRTLAPSR